MMKILDVLRGAFLIAFLAVVIYLFITNNVLYEPDNPYCEERGHLTDNIDSLGWEHVKTVIVDVEDSTYSARICMKESECKRCMERITLAFDTTEKITLKRY